MMNVAAPCTTALAPHPAPRAASPLAASHTAPALPRHQRPESPDPLFLVRTYLRPARRVVRAGECIYHAGERFGQLFLASAGFFKIVNLAADGREQVVGLKFRGDWLGFDGIAEGRYACDAIAMDTGEVWAVSYDDLLAAGLRQPALMTALHMAMSREIMRDSDSMMSVCTLPADARVADFLRYWAESLQRSGLRADQITLRMTRAEIGSYLGMTLETASRALSRLARAGLITFPEKCRRDIRIPEMDALKAFVQRSVTSAVAGEPAALLQ